MKCASCGGALAGPMTFCPFCGVRQDVNLSRIHFRDLGFHPSMACPECTTPLAMIEFSTEPAIQIERCPTCHGTFFNPGEVEALLDTQTNPLVWLDPVQLSQIAADFEEPREVFYRKCPACSERMSHVNFGGHSGVILDRCGTHGVWLDGSKLRRLTEWWRAGGKLIYQQNEEQRVKNLYEVKQTTDRRWMEAGSTAAATPGLPTPAENMGVLGQILDAAAGFFVD